MEEKELEKKAPGEAEAENIPENGAGVENTAENAAGPAGASADGEDAPENGKEEKKEKKGLFGKKKDLRDTQIEELTDQLKRSMAEFDNYRKRTMREKADLIKTGGEGALKNLLPIIDDFERALQNVRAAEDVEAVKEGVDLIFGKFMGYLSQQGVKPIEAIGKPFDTEEFEAIATIPAPELDMKGKVLDCVQTGYTLFDKVIRHAKVVVGE